MEIIGCIAFALFICAIGTFLGYVARSFACDGCPLKDKCEQFEKEGKGRLCDNDNSHVIPLS